MICGPYNERVKTHGINSGTLLYCIFGSPVRHTVSPLMHNAAFREAGINAVYLAFEPASIREAVASMRALGISGASVTIPYKIEVLGLCDEVDPHAADIGSVNTLMNAGGRITGYNTDGLGAVRALENGGIGVSGSRCLVIGNGGSARAISFALQAAGAGVIIAGRNRSRIEALAGDLGETSRSVLLGELDGRMMESVDIVINTTPVGMAPDAGSSPIDTHLIAARHAVFDIVYSPRETRLLAAAREKGCATVHGIDMLIFQGARQFEIWTGMPAPVETMARAARESIQPE